MPDLEHSIMITFVISSGKDKMWPGLKHIGEMKTNLSMQNATCQKKIIIQQMAPFVPVLTTNPKQHGEFHIQNPINTV